MKVNDILETSNVGSRESFILTWLCEMPCGTGTFETFGVIEQSIKEFLKYGIVPKEVSDGVYKLISNDVVFYWCGTNSRIDLGIELHKKPEGLVVSLTGKNPKLKGKHPFASNLYSTILTDTDRSIRILSDSQLSDEGYAIWKTLLQKGHKITIYDSKKPGHTMMTFYSIEEMDKFFKHNDDNFTRYQYVLSESLTDLAYVRTRFNLRKYRETISLKN